MTSTENDTAAPADPIPVGAQIERGVVDRAGWLPGPWDGEPDRVRWFDRATGLACIINRPGQLGHLNGYVALGRSHPLYGSSYDAADERGIEAHGGLTFDGPDPDGRGPYEGAWWFGFDTAHAGDLIPGMPRYPGFERLHSDDTYRDLAYVVAEVERVAGQLKAAAV